jgi:hypothetical protein
MRTMDIDTDLLTQSGGEQKPRDWTGLAAEDLEHAEEIGAREVVGPRVIASFLYGKNVNIRHQAIEMHRMQVFDQHRRGAGLGVLIVDIWRNRQVVV